MLSQIRTAKTQAQKNMKHPVSHLNITCQPQLTNVIPLLIEDLERAGSIEAYNVISQKQEAVFELEIVLGESEKP